MSLTISISQIEYTTVSKGAILHLFGRDKDGNAHKIDISGYRPYFYAPIKQADMLPAIGGSHVDVEKVYHTIKGQELRKIYVTHPNDLEILDPGISILKPIFHLEQNLCWIMGLNRVLK